MYYENRPKAYITQDIAMKYQDEYGGFHDSPVTENDPHPSNNRWIYTAYFYKVNNIRPTDQYDWKLIEAGEICAKYRTRHPHSYISTQTPISRDEVLGLEYLGFRVSMDGWNFSPYELPKFNLSKFINQARRLVVVNPYYKRILGVDVKLYHLELTHRNTFWKESLDQIYHLAFSTPLQDRYSILKWRGEFKFYRPDHLFYAGISLVDRLGMPSGMRYLKYGGYDNMEAMVKEFPSDHPIVKFYDRT